MPRRESPIKDPIAAHDLRRAIAAVNYDLVAVVQERMTATTGRPREQTWSCLFILLMLAAITNSASLHLTTAAEVAQRLNPKQRKKIGLVGAGSYSQIQSAVTDLASATKERINAVTGEVLPPRLGMTQTELITAIVSGPVPHHLKCRETIAIDSTDVEAHAARRAWGKTAAPDVAEDALPETALPYPKHGANRRGWPKVGADDRMQQSWDPDAREGYRSGKNLGPKEIFIGWDLHLATSVPGMGGIAMSALVIGASFCPAGSSKAVAGLELMDALIQDKRAPQTILGDRGYSYAKAENWASQLFERGIRQVIDLHTNQRGTRSETPIPHTVWVDGALFVDALPKRLRELPGYPLNMSVEDQAERAATYDERKPYKFSHLGKPNQKNGTQRLRGPALTGKVRCPNNAKSMRLDAATRPTLSCPPGKCACSVTRTIYLGNEIRTRQDTLYGTTAWRANYGRRNLVESANASLKTHHSKLARGSFRLKGTARNAIAAAFFVAANNVRVLIAAYGWDIGEPDCPPEEVRPLPSASRALHRRLTPKTRNKRRPRTKPPPSLETSNTRLPTDANKSNS